MTSLKQKIPKKLNILYLLHGGLLIAFIILLGIGTINIFSATSAVDNLGIVSFERHVELGLVGLVGGTILYVRDYEKWKPYLPALVIITYLLLVAVLAIGVEVNGAKRWLGYGAVQFQPSEIAKLTGILCTSAALAKWLVEKKSLDLFPYIDSWRSRNTVWRAASWVIPNKALWLPGGMSLLVIVQPDAGTSIVIMLVPLALIAVTMTRWLRIVPHVVIGGSVFMWYLLSASYRMDRIKAWLDPDAYIADIGYQIKQSMIAIGSGGVWGQGFGEGISKFQYLPEAHTDFAFAVLSQEGGFFVALFVVLAFLLIAICGIMTAFRCTNPFGMFLSLGITIYFCGQGFINIAMVCDLIPVVGVPLPFISYGGTALVVNCLAAALLLNVAKTNLLAARQAYREEQVRAMSHV